MYNERILDGQIRKCRRKPLGPTQPRTRALVMRTSYVVDLLLSLRWLIAGGWTVGAVLLVRELHNLHWRAGLVFLGLAAAIQFAFAPTIGPIPRRESRWRQSLELGTFALTMLTLSALLATVFIRVFGLESLPNRGPSWSDFLPLLAVFLGWLLLGFLLMRKAKSSGTVRLWQVLVLSAWTVCVASLVIARAPEREVSDDFLGIVSSIQQDAANVSLVIGAALFLTVALPGLVFLFRLSNPRLAELPPGSE